ncbi:TatD DNase family protein [Desulfohalotomaculum tongense]|uniref:TatD family hydrolase n=1 Tax=Desulforadius tongensis TaxID=1216062 RepID=UPI00195BAB23|nr:TatD family hydrolase [Desulforadius tongensis]MBM7855176.1 TatD DNase family protein [Desulforadius tongensis]
MNLIDSHAHIDDERFDEDREQVIERARQNGLSKIINIGHDLESSRRSVQLAEKYRFIYAAVGVHPHDAKDVPGDYLEQLKEMSRQDKVLSIGEIGLDYYYDLSPREVQKKVFIEQLNLAKELNLPVVIHLRDAYGDFLDIMRVEGLEPITGVMHCYSGSWEVAKECLNMGFYISFAGPVTFKNAQKVREVAARVPLERLLVETDCPYLTPVPHRGKRNEPAYVKYVAEQLAALKGITLEELSQSVCRNAEKLFGI